MNKIITDTRFEYNPETKRVELQVKSVPTKTVEVHSQTDDYVGKLPMIVVVGPETDWYAAELNTPAPTEPTPAPESDLDADPDLDDEPNLGTVQDPVVVAGGAVKKKKTSKKKATKKKATKK